MGEERLNDCPEMTRTSYSVADRSNSGADSICRRMLDMIPSNSHELVDEGIFNRRSLTAGESGTTFEPDQHTEFAPYTDNAAELPSSLLRK